MMHIAHFLFGADGAITEVPSDIATDVASGEEAMPEFADHQVRYLQVIVDDRRADEKDVQVRTAGALIHFDPTGHLKEAGVAMGEEHGITRFEHDTCVQLALDDVFEHQSVRH